MRSWIPKGLGFAECASTTAPPTKARGTRLPRSGDCESPNGGDQFALGVGNFAMMSISCPSRRMLKGSHVPGACRATTSIRSPALRIATVLFSNHASMLIGTAVEGHGVAFARTALAAWNIINGRLVRPLQWFFENAQHALDRLSEGRLRAYQRSQRSENGCWPRRPTMGAASRQVSCFS